MRIEITVKQLPETLNEDKLDKSESSMVLDISYEQSLDAWADTFKQIMRFLTFTEESINEVIIEEY